MPTADTLFEIETPSRTPSSGGEKKILLLKPRVDFAPGWFEERSM